MNDDSRRPSDREVPQELADELDLAARRLHRNRADLVRQALEHFLDELDQWTLGLDRLLDPSDPLLDWSAVKRDLLDSDQA